MDKILLVGVHLTVNLGVPHEERSIPQEVILDLEMEFDTRPAGESDDFKQTVDYAAVHTTVRRVATERHYSLVECMAERIAAAVLLEFPVAGVRVLLKKPAALRARNVDYPAIEILRRRHA
ncbi:dihydroneopterin aldolase [uncultured Paludibaculum sp.]|uniref:dihydroneopterin aldolase n=1 Tax=uncultured Paludibaculum sp. TaxID=1765020 RepID=UPI002AAA9FD5|nr:dihydroneopterin aldolase [uncultured Paludibaculum sp.]